MSKNKTSKKSINTVTMKDGRQVDFGARFKLKKNIQIVGEGASKKINLSIDVINGDTHVLEIDANHPLFFELAAYGASQRISDSVAQIDDGNNISDRIADQIKKINSGIWPQITKPKNKV